jgi:hypothetical protein
MSLTFSVRAGALERLPQSVQLQPVRLPMRRIERNKRPTAAAIARPVQMGRLSRKRPHFGHCRSPRAVPSMAGWRVL